MLLNVQKKNDKRNHLDISLQEINYYMAKQSKTEKHLQFYSTLKDNTIQGMMGKIC